ncbi:hypothetical protein [Streptomyces sp. NPDC004682]
MAEAKKIEKTVVDGITLTLTPDEAAVLLSLTGNVIGDRYASPRKHADAVYYALKKTGAETKFNKNLSGTTKLTADGAALYGF